MSTDNIVQFTLDEKIRLSYIKHRGNLIRVAEELHVDIAYVKRVGKKLKYRTKRDADQLIAQTIMMHLLEGYDQRVAYLQEALTRIHDEDAEQIKISNCCKHIAICTEVDGHKTYVCTHCNKPCYTTTATDKNITSLRLRLIAELRKEDSALSDFAARMGYTQAESPTIYKQNVVVLEESERRKQIDSSVVNKEVYTQLKDMKPMDREKARKRIEDEILEQANEAD